MWRWIHSLPRAIRQQAHGPGASAGICREEIHEHEVPKEGPDVQTIRRNWRKHRKFRENIKKWKVEQGFKETCPLSGSKFWKDDQPNADHQRGNKWRKHCNFRGSSQKQNNGKENPNSNNFWDLANGKCRTLDALKWGGLMSAGMQVGQLHTYRTRKQQYEMLEEPKQHCLFYQISNVLPKLGDLQPKCGIAMNVAGCIGQSSKLNVDATKTKQTEHKTQSKVNRSPYQCFLADINSTLEFDIPKPQFSSSKPRQWTQKKPESKTEEEIVLDQPSPQIETLEAVFNSFQDTCKVYEATGKGLMGSQAAVKGNIDSAAKHWEESSILGHTKSQFNLAVCYETGQGVEKDMKKAMHYYELAADEGLHVQAMYNLALLYIEGTPPVVQDHTKAVHLLNKAADLGMVEAARYLGVYYTEEGQEDVTKAIHYLTSAADHQDAESQYLLGMCYECGYGVEENVCKAAYLYSKAADSGHTDAMYSLAGMHQHGLGGLPQDKHCAKELYQKASDLGHLEARIELQELTSNIDSKDMVVSLENEVKQTAVAANTEVKNTEEPISREPPPTIHQMDHLGFLLKLNNSVSTPCLTDHVRQDISQYNYDGLYEPVSDTGTLSQIYTQLMVPRSLTVPPSLTRVNDTRRSSESSESDSGIVFKLGSDDSSAGSSPIPYPEIESPFHRDDDDDMGYMGLHRRTSTMPDLHNMISCK